MNMVLAALTLLVSGAAVSVVLSSWRKAALAAGLMSSVFACVAILAGALRTLTGENPLPAEIAWPLPLGTFRLVLDGLSAWFLLMIGTVGLCATVYSWGYYDGGKSKEYNRAYPLLFCVVLAALILTVAAGDALVFLIGWELTSLSAFFLVGLNDRDADSRYGAWTYLIAAHLGTAFGVLPLFALFISRTGSSDMALFPEAFTGADAVAAAAFALGVVGFGTKAGFFPFHVWLPLAHPVAPSPVSALMSGVVIKIGIYGLFRTVSWLPDLPASCGSALLFLSAITALLAILNALGQRDIKRMLAYSSVENIGIVGLGLSVAMLGRSLHVPLLVACGLSGALLHALNHSLFKGMLFLSAGAVLHGAGTGDIERLGGLSKYAPGTSLAFLTGSVAICALPPLNGFVSEFLIYKGLLHGSESLPLSYAGISAAAITVLALTGAIALLVFSKVFAVTFLGHPRDTSIRMHKVPATMNAAMMFLAICCVAVVALPGAVATALGVATQRYSGLSDNPLQDVGPYTVSPAIPLLVFAVIALILWGARRALPRGGEAATWGCGYARPASAMQYTGSSYSWTLLSAFRQAVRPQRRFPGLGSGCFPEPARLETAQRDLALDNAYRPSFLRIERFFEKLWPLQHGRVQLYLVYIVATIFLVFLAESRFTPFHSDTRVPDAEARPVAAAATSGSGSAK
ncbi:MAG: oxidoreductase [Candidatus Hydrogenedentes bacterium]|nr:oxidoreductase [Candidatus Hydrogenedentota bacterium]